MGAEGAEVKAIFFTSDSFLGLEEEEEEDEGRRRPGGGRGAGTGRGRGRDRRGKFRRHI